MRTLVRLHLLLEFGDLLAVVVQSMARLAQYTSAASIVRGYPQPLTSTSPMRPPAHAGRGSVVLKAQMSRQMTRSSPNAAAASRNELPRGAWHRRGCRNRPTWSANSPNLDRVHEI